MHENFNYLAQVLILLTASILNVVISRKLKLSPVLGYLFLGILIGDHGLRLVDDSHMIHTLSEFGVVFLLFVIGLELTFERLMQMRVHVFGFGGLQILLTTIALSYVLQFFFKFNMTVSILVGCALSLSSTAIVLQVLNESKRQSSQVGRVALATLLMQDFAVVPLLAILPILKSPSDTLFVEIGMAGFKSLIAIIVVTVAGRIFLRPFFSIINSAKSEELYVSTTLLIVLGASYVTTVLAQSTAMGAFIAGILIAETEYHHRVENSIMPFKSLLLGLFFLSVGMSLNYEYILSEISDVLIISLALIATKALVITGIALLFKLGIGSALHAGFLLAQGSEFAFILFNLAAEQKIFSDKVSQLLLVVVSFTMAITPLIALIGRYIEDKMDANQDSAKPQEFKGVSDLSEHVIISGFGRVGRVVAKMLEVNKINYVAVDSDLQIVKKARAQGYPVYHGDLSNPDVLKAVGADRSSCAILAVTDKISLRKAVKTIYSHYKHLEIITLAEDFKHGYGLKKLGASIALPVTIETGLQLGGNLLKNLGIPEHDIFELKEQFRQNNYSFTEEIELFRGVVPNKQTVAD